MCMIHGDHFNQEHKKYEGYFQAKFNCFNFIRSGSSWLQNTYIKLKLRTRAGLTHLDIHCLYLEVFLQ